MTVFNQQRDTQTLERITEAESVVGLLPYSSWPPVQLHCG